MATPEELQEFLDTARPMGCARLNTSLLDDPNVETGLSERDSKIVGYAQLVEGRGGCTFDLITVEPGAREELAKLAPDEGELTWWGHDNPADAALADSLGMRPPHRRLLNMSRSLPLESDLAAVSDTVEVRPFVVGQDEQAWLAVNNAAFDWHSEQGGWELATLRERLSEPWFEPRGFLLHERDGRLAAFCWTKAHANRVGEIFVIAVHPDFHGLGLGRAMTVAGLEWLARAGSNFAMLYVEADNTSAVRLYDSLGFRTTHVDVAYHRPATTTGDTK